MKPILSVTAIVLLGIPQGRPKALKPSWDIPKEAFVEYKRERVQFLFKGDRRILRGKDSAPGFMGRELNRKGQLLYRDGNILDLIPMVALSPSNSKSKLELGKKRALRLLIPHCEKLGGVEIRGFFRTQEMQNPRAIQQEGVFTLRVNNTLLPDLASRFRSEALFRGSYDLADTKLSLQRWWNLPKGRVSRFHAHLKGTIVPRNGGRKRKFEIEETWSFVGIRRRNTPWFRQAVREGIKRGTRFLMNRVATWEKDGSFRDTPKNRLQNTYGSGRLALVLLTLLKQNPDRDTPVIQKLVDQVRKRLPNDSYSLGLSLMALEALYEPPNEAQQIRDGLIQSPSQRKPHSKDLMLMKKWVKRLLENIDTRSDPSYKLRFNYTRGGRYDNSVTQYAALGLRSAALCGISLPGYVWPGLLNHFIADQKKKEQDRPLRFRLISFAEQAKMKSQKDSSKATSAFLRAKARGFGYSTTGFPYGSMTCAGITGLALSESMLRRNKRINKRQRSKTDKGLLSAFAWLLDNFSVRKNPRRDNDHYFYYLYSLERACQLSGIALIGQKDWYFEGAMQILLSQQANGSWGNLTDTCFAILFLKRAVAPARTGR